jgi:hypothetical protein
VGRGDFQKGINKSKRGRKMEEIQRENKKG